MRAAKVIPLLLAAALISTSAITASAKYDADIDAPDDVKEICEKYGAEYDICPELLEAICWNESRYLANVSAGTCKGIMQINEPVHKDRLKNLGVTDIYDMDGNIHAGADYLFELFETYNDPAVVLAYYHGEQNVLTRTKKGQLSGYVKRVLEKSEMLEKLHGK